MRGCLKIPNSSGHSAQRLTDGVATDDILVVLLALIPLAAFVLAFLVGAVFLLVIWKGARTSVRNDAAGQAVHIERTPDPVQRVWDFYRRELPDWQVNPDQDIGRELFSRKAGAMRKIRVHQDRDRTVIDISVST